MENNFYYDYGDSSYGGSIDYEDEFLEPVNGFDSLKDVFFNCIFITLKQVLVHIVYLMGINFIYRIIVQYREFCLQCKNIQDFNKIYFSNYSDNTKYVETHRSSCSRLLIDTLVFRSRKLLFLPPSTTYIWIFVFSEMVANQKTRINSYYFHTSISYDMV